MFYVDNNKLSGFQKKFAVIVNNSKEKFKHLVCTAGMEVSRTGLGLEAGLET